MRAEGNLIAVESKRYGESTSLSTRELIGELHQAKNDLPGLDLWVLIVTREVFDQDEKELQKVADRLGFEALIIDARNEGLGNIDVFFSEYPELTIDFCVAHAEHTDRQRLMQQLEDIRRDPSYGNMVEQLRATLAVTVLGYDDARHRAAVLLLNQLTTRSQSKAVFGQDIGLMDPGRVTMVERGEIDNTLNNWWQNWSRGCLHVALLGEEGTGKTWAMFSWLYGRTNKTDGPIILPITSTGLPPSAGLASVFPQEFLCNWGSSGILGL